MENLQKLEIDDSNRDEFNNKVDILFIIDTTCSMGTYFKEAKQTILDISQMFTKQEFDMKFAVCEYRDHPPQEKTFVYKHYDLSDSQKMAKVVQSLTAVGGGDYPEAVMDGLYYGLKLTSWRSDKHDDKLTISKRFIFHICDAPPHGAQYGSHSSNKEWQENGCPCKITIQMIRDQIKEKKVMYNLVECRQLDLMISIFKDFLGESFQEVIKIPQRQRKYNLHKLSSDSDMKKSSCIGGGGGSTNYRKRNFSINTESEESSTEHENNGNIFNLQIQQNIRKNLI